jgi:hypothetical protein
MGIVVYTRLWLTLLVVVITRGWNLLSIPSTQCIGVLMDVAWVALTIAHAWGRHSTITSRPVSTTTGAGTLMSSVTQIMLLTAVAAWLMMTIGSRTSGICVVLVRKVREVVSRRRRGLGAMIGGVDPCRDGWIAQCVYIVPTDMSCDRSVVSQRQNIERVLSIRRTGQTIGGV